MTTTYLPRQIELGSNSIDRLGEIAIQQGAKRLFVIIDAFLASEPIKLDKKIADIIEKDKLDVSYFSGYKGEPTTDHLEAALQKLHEVNADCVVAVGGGSAIDIAKAVSLFALNPEMKWEEISTQSRLDGLPLIAIPTTAGTGSEATKVMVVTNTETQFKMNPGHKDLVPDVSILDPELTKSLPTHFTAYTGMDALTHAIEAYVSTKANQVTDNYALSAIEMIGKALPEVYEDGTNIKAREEMLLASCYAGIAFSNASTNLAHAAGRPLGARFHIPHGLSVALLLPFVMQFGLDNAAERYSQVAKALGAGGSEESAVEMINSYNEQFGIWRDGLNYIDLDDLKQNINILVKDALSGNGIATNRKVPGEKDVAEIYVALIDKLKQIKEAYSLSK